MCHKDGFHIIIFVKMPYTCKQINVTFVFLIKRNIHNVKIRLMKEKRKKDYHKYLAYIKDVSTIFKIVSFLLNLHIREIMIYKRNSEYL